MIIGSGRESFGIYKIPDEKKYTQSSMAQTHNAALRTEKAFRVTISEEGAKSYRDSLYNSAEYKAAAYDERSELIDIMSKSVVDIAGEIESDLHLRYTGLNTEAGGEKCGAGDFAGNLLKAYTDIYQEIKKGYADGTREIWTADSIKDRYEAHKGDLTYLVDQVMQENWQVNFKGGLTV